jgi:hypothetical protein
MNDGKSKNKPESAVQRISRMPFVRFVSGLLAVAYCAIVAGSCVSFVRTSDRFNVWEILGQAFFVLIMWWVISMHGRIAIYGEFTTEIGMFAPRQNRSER